VVGLRRVGETAMAPAPASLELEAEYTQVTRGMVTLVVRSDPEPAAAPKKPDVDRGPPLRHLESEEQQLPPGWRD